MDRDRSGEEDERTPPEPMSDTSGETTARAGAPNLNVQKEELPKKKTDATGRITARAGGGHLEGPSAES